MASVPNINADPSGALQQGFSVGAAGVQDRAGAGTSVEPDTGCVTVNYSAMGLKPSNILESVDAKGTFKAKIDGNRILLENVAPYFFAGIIAH